MAMISELYFQMTGQFARQVEDFGGQYNILLLDIIGHGQSRKTKKGDGIEKMSVWIREILDAEKIEKIHLVGISLGAVLAQDFANYYPEYVSSLACFGGYNINNFDMTMQKENAGEQMRMMLRALVSVRWFAKENKKVSAYTKEAQDAFYEMNEESLRTEIVGEREVYFFANNARNGAAWHEDEYLAYFSGDISEQEVEKMVQSIFSQG